MAKFATIDAYIASLPESSRGVATSICSELSAALPGSVAAIKYNIPVFLIANHPIIYFAVWKKHVGLYPIYKGTEEFEHSIASYRAKTDTVQFALNEPLPLQLIAKIAQSQLKRWQISI
jgi:uncharacterized protein YdhG (YjbR/CyaY superfamily)